ncbi:MAG: peptidoglycan recognition protein family protein [Moorellales bacterium]
MDWGYVVVHHTGAEEKDAEQVRRYHLSLGWRDVGYHFLIERDGRLVRGRSLDLPGAHCAAANMNRRGIGVAVIGNLQERPPTEAQAAALLELVFCLCRVWGLEPERVLGHREVPGASTLCPGRYLDPAALRARLSRARWGVVPAGHEA